MRADAQTFFQDDTAMNHRPTIHDDRQARADQLRWAIQNTVDPRDVAALREQLAAVQAGLR